VTLTVAKLPYSRSPWRILWNGLELPHAWYPLKREAVSALTELEELPLPWDTPYEEWTLYRQHLLREWLDRQPAALLRAGVLKRQSEGKGLC